MKKLKKILLALTATYSCLVSAQLNPIQEQIRVQEFINTFNQGLSVLIKDYSKQVKSPLDAQILNIADPQVYRFLKVSSKTNINGHFMAMVYFPEYKIDERSTSFCFTLYDDKKRRELAKYYSLFPNKDYALNYLMAHEFSHCMYKHQQQIKGLAFDLTPQQDESFADMFAYAFFETKGYANISKSILFFSKVEKINTIHQNDKELIEFISYYDKNKANIKSDNILDIFNFTYNYIHQAQELENYGVAGYIKRY